MRLYLNANAAESIVSDRKLAAAFTGHRAASLPWKSDEHDERCIALKNRICAAVIEAYSEGKRYFISGMASGVDTYSAEAVIGLKQTLPEIKLICVFPFPPRDKRSLSIEEKCDLSAIVCNEYIVGCHELRNRLMIANSSMLIACWDGRTEGGTYRTISLAEEKGSAVKLIRI